MTKRYAKNQIKANLLRLEAPIGLILHFNPADLRVVTRITFEKITQHIHTELIHKWQDRKLKKLVYPMAICWSCDSPRDHRMLLKSNELILSCSRCHQQYVDRVMIGTGHQCRYKVQNELLNEI